MTVLNLVIINVQNHSKLKENEPVITGGRCMWNCR